jgi:hypothetical protein
MKPEDDPANYTYEKCYPPSPELQEYLEERDKEAKTVEKAVAEAKKARQAESMKRAKAKYYQKKKEDPEFVEMMREKAKTYYTVNKDVPEYKEQHRLYTKKYYEMNRDRTNEYYQNYHHNKKVKELTQRLETFGFEKIATIVIANKKTKMFNDFENE